MKLLVTCSVLFVPLHPRGDLKPHICGCLLPEDDCSPMLKKPVGAARKHNTQLAKHRKAQRGRPTLDQIKITALMQPTTIEEDDAGGSDEGGNSDDEIGNRQVSKCVAASDNSL